MSRRHVTIYRTFSAPPFPPILAFYDPETVLNPGWRKGRSLHVPWNKWILAITH